MNHPFIQNGQYNTKPELLMGVMLLDTNGKADLPPIHYRQFITNLAPLIAPDKADAWLTPYKRGELETAWNHVANHLSPETCEAVYTLNLGLNKTNKELFPIQISNEPALTQQEHSKIQKELEQITTIRAKGNNFFKWATPLTGLAALGCHVVGVPAPDPQASFNLAATLLTNTLPLFVTTFCAHGVFLGYDFAMNRRTTKLVTKLIASGTKKVECAAALCKILTSGQAIARHLMAQTPKQKSNHQRPTP